MGHPPSEDSGLQLCCRGVALVKGELWGAVDPLDCDWMIEEREGTHRRCVVITLGKLHVSCCKTCFCLFVFYCDKYFLALFGKDLVYYGLFFLI